MPAKKKSTAVEFTGEELGELYRDYEDYAELFDDLMGRVENLGHLRTFGRGQLSSIEHKALEPIALAEGTSPRLLQFFFSQYKWDENSVRDRVQSFLAQRYSEPEGVFIIDETSDAKKGKATAGIRCQYCGERGKKENCLDSVHLAYVNGNGFHALLDGQLYLGKTWDKDTGIEEIEQLRRALSNGVEGRYASADEGYGNKPWWRDEIQRQEHDKGTRDMEVHGTHVL